MRSTHVVSLSLAGRIKLEVKVGCDETPPCPPSGAGRGLEQSGYTSPDGTLSLIWLGPISARIKTRRTHSWTWGPMPVRSRRLGLHVPDSSSTTIPRPELSFDPRPFLFFELINEKKEKVLVNHANLFSQRFNGWPW